MIMLVMQVGEITQLVLALIFMIPVGITLGIPSDGLILSGDGTTGVTVVMDMDGAGTDGTDGTTGVMLVGDGTLGDGTDMA